MSKLWLGRASDAACTADVIVVPDSIRFWARLTGQLSLMAVLVLAAASAPEMARLQVLLWAFDALLGMLFLQVPIRVLRRRPQVIADERGLVLTTWCRDRVVAWADIKAIEPVLRLGAPTRGLWHLPPVMDRWSAQRIFRIHLCSGWARSYVVHEVPGHDIDADRHRLVEAWRAHCATPMPVGHHG